MTDRKLQDQDIVDALFTEARSAAVTPDSGLMARVLADADRLQPTRPVAVASPPQGINGLWWQLLDGLGGWPALGGLVAAGVAGLWVGMVPPAGVADLTAQLLGTSETVTLAPDTSMFSFEDLTDG